MYKQASETKLRFNTNRGSLSVEDLWDMPLTSDNGFSLDDLAKEVNKQLKNSEESFVDIPKTDSITEVLELQLNILKDIIKTRVEARDQYIEDLRRKQDKDKIIGIIADKENDVLKSKSIASLKKMVESL